MATMDNTSKSSDSIDRPSSNLLPAAPPLTYPGNVTLCYPPQPSPLTDGGQAPGTYLVPPPMASPSSCLATQQMYTNYPPSPYYRSMLGSQQSYYGTILPTPGHHSTAFYGTFYNPSSPSVYSGQAQASLNHPINYYSPSLYMPQNHEAMWNSGQQPSQSKRSYASFDAGTPSLEALPSCSKVNLSSAPTVTENPVNEESVTSSCQPKIPVTTATPIETEKNNFSYENLDRPVSDSEACLPSEDEDEEDEDGEDEEEEVEEEETAIENPTDASVAEEAIVEMVEPEERDEELEKEDDSYSSSCSASTCSSDSYSDGSSCLSGDLDPMSPILEHDRRFLEVVGSRVSEDPNVILQDASFGDGEAHHSLKEDWGNADEGLQCLLCTSDDHLLPRLDIAIKLEPVVGEHISKSVLLCTACDLMMERYLTLEKEVTELQVQIQLMYQNNKEIEAARGAQTAAAVAAADIVPPNFHVTEENLGFGTSSYEMSVPNSGSSQPTTEENSPVTADLPPPPISTADEVHKDPGSEKEANAEPLQATEGEKEAGQVDCVTSHQCDQCEKYFTDRTHLKRHAKTHGKWEHRCDVCGQILSNKASWRNHLRLHRTDQTFQCQQCARTFSRRAQYVYHIKVHHGSTDIQCHVCHKAFSSRGSLKTHMRIHSGEKPYTCQTCGRGFNVSSNLLAHLPICNKQLPFKCQECDKSFGTRSSYQTHMKIHQGGLSFKCDVCGAGFAKPSHLTAHQRIHTKEKPYQCPICGKSFSSLGNCNSHQKTHQADQRRFVCEICGKRFSRRHGLETHLNRHTGVKPYQCLQCPKAFHDASNLINHSKTHSKKTST